MLTNRTNPQGCSRHYRPGGEIISMMARKEVEPLPPQMPWPAVDLKRPLLSDLAPRDSRPAPEAQRHLVMEILEAAAESGSVCPPNSAISRALGGMSISYTSRIISILEDEGLIIVERYNSNQRAVIIVATGKATALGLKAVRR